MNRTNLTLVRHLQAVERHKIPAWGAEDAPFEEVLRLVIRLARALEWAGPEPAAGGIVSGAAAPSAAVDQRQSPNDILKEALEELGGESRRKLQALLIAGQTGSSIGEASTPDSNSFDAWLSKPGLLVDCLQRARAMACATEFELDRPLVEWQAPETVPSVDDRDWLRFGRQLALGRIADWDFFAVMDEPASRQMTRLYWRLHGEGWWSFRRQLDRPPARLVEGLRMRSPIVCSTLRELASPPYFVTGSALRRALRAIRLRLDSVYG